jgi:hypothetical protein
MLGWFSEFCISAGGDLDAARGDRSASSDEEDVDWELLMDESPDEIEKGNDGGGDEEWEFVEDIEGMQGRSVFSLKRTVHCPSFSGQNSLW